MQPRSISIGDTSLQILKELGQGTYGTVYLTETQRGPKAIKILTNQKEEGLKSLTEVDIMCRLRHPNLVPAEGIIVGVGEEVTLGIIMPLAVTDLYRHMIDPSVSTNRRLKLLHDVSDGLKFLHDSEYVHLDLKPVNVLIFGTGNQETARITDFGLSMYLGEDKYQRHGYDLVTITHRPPEILNRNYIYSKSTDIWSLGIIFLEVLSGGYRIFTNYEWRSVKHTINQLFNAKSIDYLLEEYLKKLPRPIKKDAITIIKRMLDFDPNQRATIDEVLSSKLFTHIRTKEKVGRMIYEPPMSPRSCNIIYYYGFDYMLRLALRFPIKTETFFLASDIYQRALAFGHVLTGDFNKDWPNVSLLGTTSFYMATKTIETSVPEINTLAEIASNAFPPGKIVEIESILTQLFEGRIYSKNLFTQSRTKSDLIQGFDLLRNCHVYYNIDIDRWGQSGKKYKNNSNNSKNTELRKFIKETNYYNYVRQTSQEYIKDLYEKDKMIVMR